MPPRAGALRAAWTSCRPMASHQHTTQAQRRSTSAAPPLISGTLIRDPYPLCGGHQGTRPVQIPRHSISTAGIPHTTHTTSQQQRPLSSTANHSRCLHHNTTLTHLRTALHTRALRGTQDDTAERSLAPASRRASGGLGEVRVVGRRAAGPKGPDDARAGPKLSRAGAGAAGAAGGGGTRGFGAWRPFNVVYDIRADILAKRTEVRVHQYSLWERGWNGKIANFSQFSVNIVDRNIRRELRNRYLMI